MRLNTLTVTNFRVFSGTHSIDLRPREINGRRRPIVLFGGLNGSGKTSLLAGVRLALYGADSLGPKTSKRVYQTYLEECMHQSSASKSDHPDTSVSLEYEHPEKGTTAVYKVSREWFRDKGLIEEKLKIQRNGDPLNELSYDQIQSLLREHVPVGVSELFFFDGEKISSLADDEGGSVLRDAVNRLMGIDTVHRLRADLATYLREKSKEGMSKSKRQKLHVLEREHEVLRQEFEQRSEAKALLEDQLQQVNAEIASTERLLDERGGAWAASRAAEKVNLDGLMKERDNLNSDIISEMSGLFPLALAKKSFGTLLETLESEQVTKRRNTIRDALEGQLAELEKNLNAVVPATNRQAISRVIVDTFEGMLEETDTPIIHDLSESKLAEVRHTLSVLVPTVEDRLRAKADRLEDVEGLIDAASNNIDRSPDKALIAEELERLRTQVKQKAELEVKIGRAREDAKRGLRAVIEVVKQLRRFEQDSVESDQLDNATNYATKSRAVLETFATRSIALKLEKLETEFERAFRKLVRKDDLHFSVSIDPESFAVTLRDTNGENVDRRQLSAGEKQIYAIAMLEALGRTTGRNLPIIIDTPLGRLDTKHRENLVHNYFPTASHQVIILSTDTEVDEKFFNSLQDDISHGFEICYDSSAKSSSFREGYFWKPAMKEAV